jgi:hypothetical protein
MHFIIHFICGVFLTFLLVSCWDHLKDTNVLIHQLLDLVADAAAQIVLVIIHVLDGDTCRETFDTVQCRKIDQHQLRLLLVIEDAETHNADTHVHVCISTLQQRLGVLLSLHSKQLLTKEGILE